ncbi:DUF4180 domain-containing protein [Lachnospiraceae bacterium 54-53]
MRIEKIVNAGKNVAYIETDEIIMTDVQSALDLLVTVSFEYECEAIIINKSSITEEFFDLSTRLAGEIVQKYVNYGMRLAIIGDFSNYKSKALHDFIYECNHGRNLYFVKDENEALLKLS